MTKNGGIQFIPPQKVNPVNTNIDISSFQITNIEEINEEWRDWLYFDVNGVRYLILLTADLDNLNSSSREIGFVDHEENKCLFCGPGVKKDQICMVLSDHSKALFDKVVKSSKNRLRWLSKEIY